MFWNVVELSENGRYAKLHRGFLVVLEGDDELGRVIIDELSCLMLTAEQSTLSKPVMVRLAEEGIPIVICGKNYHPISMNLPVSAHHQSTKVLHAQIAISQPFRKRLWQHIVKTKIHHQQQVLQWCHPNETISFKQLAKCISKVKSGDPENIEAQAARIYWQVLMGKHFTRQNDSDDFINSALNYGYTILRAACARAVVAAGLQPALGLHHHNQNNPFCLVDDLMEVYRPLVDRIVFQALPQSPDINSQQTTKTITNTITNSQQIIDDKIDFGDSQEGGSSNDESSHHPIESYPKFSSQHKRVLVKTLQQTVLIDKNHTTVSNSMQIMAFSLTKSYQLKENHLKLPALISDNDEE